MPTLPSTTYRACVVALAVAVTGCPDTGGTLPATESPEAAPALTFAEVTEAAGLGGFRHTNGGFGQAWAPEIVGGGGGFLDYDGDGWLDALLVGGGAFMEREGSPHPALWLYRNNGDGTFTAASDAAGLGGVRAYGFGVAAADYDNDGDEDFFLTTLYEDMLFRNDGGVFTEVGKAAGLADVAEWSTASLFFDADRDGDLDLFVGSYVDWSPEKDRPCYFEGQKVYCTPQEYDGIASRFYRNNGDGTFTDRTREAGFAAGIEPSRDKTLGVAELDFNNDGWPDVVVANDTERDQLYENNGDGTFTEKGIRSGIAFDQYGKPRAGMGIDIGVIDSSGQAAVFVGNFTEETVGVYLHTGDGLFLDRAKLSRIGHPSLMTLTFGLFLFDADLDTDLDLLTANGHVQTQIERILQGVTFRQRAQLYLNRGNGLFDEHLPPSGPLTQPLVARGAAYADYDRDGDLDVLLTENNGPAHLWRNDLMDGHFLRVRLRGRRSNREGLGARIVAEVGGLRMERRVRTGSSYLSQSEKVAVFGLGGSVSVSVLEVYWPSGVVDRLEGVLGDQEVRIEEGSSAYERVSMPDRIPTGV